MSWVTNENWKDVRHNVIVRPSFFHAINSKSVSLLQMFCLSGEFCSARTLSPKLCYATECLRRDQETRRGFCAADVANVLRVTARIVGKK